MSLTVSGDALICLNTNDNGISLGGAADAHGDSFTLWKSERNGNRGDLDDLQLMVSVS